MSYPDWRKLLLLPALLLSTPLLGESYDIAVLKVALTYNFAKYVHWPDVPARADLTMCYFGDGNDRFFAQVQGKRVGERSVVVRRTDSVSRVSGCDLVYLGTKERSLMTRLHYQLERQPVLTISDIPGYVSQGGMIELIESGEKLRFKINQREVKNAGLDVSAQILKLALEVRK